MERSPIMACPAKVEPEASLGEMIKQVLQLVQKDGPLSKKQAEFCDDACVLRYLKARGNNVRRAARMLRATLDWREKINIGYLIADEFPAELATGAAYVAGHDVEGRPILIVGLAGDIILDTFTLRVQLHKAIVQFKSAIFLIIKKKPEFILNLSHKQYLRFLIFTMEVAIAAMPSGVDQWVLILDASGYSTLSAPSTSGILTTFKMLSDHYPERLGKAFVVDASPMFYYVWKGICTFVDHSTRRKLNFTYSRDYRVIPRPQYTSKMSFLTSPFSKHSRRRSSSFCAEEPNAPISFRSKADYTLLEPIFDTIPERNEDSKSVAQVSEGPELGSSMRRRSVSFSSVTGSITCSSPDRREEEFGSFRTDDEDKVGQPEISGSAPARARPSKAPSWNGLVSIFKPAKRDAFVMTDDAKSRSIVAFRPYFTFLQAPFDEAAYRALMKPPLCGLATIVSRDLKRTTTL